MARTNGDGPACPPASSAPTVVCDRCALTTTAPDLLSPVRGRRLCPRCLSHRQANEARRLRRIGLTGGLVGLLLLGVAPAQGYLLLNLAALLPLASLASLALHELGHALAARLLGFRVYSVTLGQGPLLFARRWGRVDLMLRALPLGGYTEAGATAPRLLRLRAALFVAAGPLANALALVCLLPRWPGGLLAQLSGGLAPVPLLLATNGVSLLLSLLPSWPQSRADRHLADGPTLLEALRGRADWARQRLAAGWYLAALDAHCTQPAARADEVLAQALSRFPDDPRLRRLAGEMAMSREDWPAASACFGELLAGEGAGEARWWDALSLARSLAYEQRDLALAEALTAEVAAAMPWDPLVLGTRGLVLVAMGRDAEGAELLDQAAGGALAPAWRAEFGAWQARALEHLGRAAEAQGVLARDGR